MADLKHARLAVAGHKLPHPFNPTTEFPAEGQKVDVEHPVWMQLIADGSLTLEGALPSPKRKEKD